MGSNRDTTEKKTCDLEPRRQWCGGVPKHLKLMFILPLPQMPSKDLKYLKFALLDLGLALIMTLPRCPCISPHWNGMYSLAQTVYCKYMAYLFYA